MSERTHSSRAMPLAMVMFGASGDLAARKLLPALASLAGEGSLPEGFGLVGVGADPGPTRSSRATASRPPRTRSRRGTKS